MMKEEEEGPVNVAGDEGGVCTSQGFVANGVIAGIRVSENPDTALIINQGPEKTVVATFTTDRAQAVPVTVSKKHIAGGKLSAVVLNFGNTNACNGQPGIANAPRVCQEAVDEFGADTTEIGTCSTGLIDDRLLMDIVPAGVPELCENLGSDAAVGTAAVEAILTTDLVAKQAAAHDDGFTVGAMDKGVGMTSPSIVTMLGATTTDASVSAEMAHEAVVKVSEVTFNHPNIDGSTSTNDTVTILANGALGMKPPQGELDQAVLSVYDSTACQTQSDVKGVTRRVSVAVRGAGGAEDALVAVRIIGRDNLFKCTMFGSDPNWGRVLAAVGIAPVDMDSKHTTVSFNGHVVCRDTGGTPDTREVDPPDKSIAVEVDLGTGNPEEATTRTTDLPHDYVHINLAYSS